MKQVTKKAFKELHSSGKLELLNMITFNTAVETHVNSIRTMADNGHAYNCIKVSRVETDDDGEYRKVKVFRTEYKGETYYHVEYVIDNAVSRMCSDNSVKIETISYKVKQCEQ